MSTFGMDEWLADGRTPLNAPILAADYMDLILERQRVYEAVKPPVKWARTLPEWFVWPGDDDHVILPERVTAEPKPKRTPPTREALIAKRDALQSQLGRLIDKRDRAVLGPRHGTDDMAAYGGIGIRTTARQNAKRAAAMDRSITETARLMKRISQVTGSLARVEHQIARADR